METTVVNVHHQSCDIFIGRPSMWGNPFKISPTMPREKAITLYRIYLSTNKELLSKVHTLHGKRLGCFCAPSACHGDVLKEYADAAYERLNSNPVPETKNV